MGTKGRIDVDERYSPLHVFTFEGVVGDAEFAAYLERSLELAMRGRHAVVFDATRAGLVPASQRRMQAEWMIANDKLNRETLVAAAFVLPSPLLRGLVTAVLFLHPMPCPHRVFSSLDAAMTWSRGQLAYRGVAQT